MSASLFAATTETTVTTTTSPLRFLGNVDANLTSIRSSGAGSKNPDLGIDFTVGVDGIYMLNEQMGVGLGLDYNRLRGKESGQTATAGYLDIPVNFAYVVPTNSSLAMTFLVGPYIGIPVSKWKDAGGTDVKSNLAVGANLEGHADWTVSNRFAIGPHLGFKYAFNDLVNERKVTGVSNLKVNYWAVSLGVSVALLP